MWFFQYFVTDPAVEPPRHRPMLSLQHMRPGVEAWLDGVDGFGDQFFERRQPGEQLTFLPREAGELPGDLALFESQPIVHVRLMEVHRHGVDARAVIERVQPLGEWSRSAELKADDTLDSVPGALRPDEALLEIVRRQRLWISPHKQWRLGLPGASAIYLCRDDAGAKRCTIITCGHAPCYLVAF